MYNIQISFWNKTRFDQDIVESLKIFMRSRLIVVHVEYFQIIVESFQKRVILTIPTLVFLGIQRLKLWSCVERPKLGLVFYMYRHEAEEVHENERTWKV
jgi:hypothetical protein